MSPVYKRTLWDVTPAARTGAVRYDAELRRVADLERLVDPGVAIPLAVQRLVGIGPDDVRGAPVPVEESVAWIVKLNEPAAVGVPLTTPALLNVRPAGNAPTVTPRSRSRAPASAGPDLITRRTEACMDSPAPLHQPHEGGTSSCPVGGSAWCETLTACSNGP